MESSEKPTVVQVKRKRNEEPFESLWLEVTTRPSKRLAPGINNLSLEAATDPPDVLAPTKLLFRRVESLSSSGIKNILLPQLLEKVKERKRPRDASDNRQTKKTKDQEIARTARFEQLRKSRRSKEKSEEEDDSGRELFHLYEVLRVDVEAEIAEIAEKAARREKAKREAKLTELLCNYLPLLREHLPDLAAEIDASSTAYYPTNFTTDVPAEEYVYDVYTLDEEMEDAEKDEVSIPTIQVLDNMDNDWRDLKDSDYDSEDSNDENNPNNDYPEEEDELSGGGFQSDSSGYDLADVDPYAQGSEEYDTTLSDDDKGYGIWKPRK